MTIRTTVWGCCTVTIEPYGGDYLATLPGGLGGAVGATVDQARLMAEQALTEALSRLIRAEPQDDRTTRELHDPA